MDADRFLIISSCGPMPFNASELEHMQASNNDKNSIHSGTLAGRKAAMKARRAERRARGEAAKEILDSKTREKRVAISTLEVASRILDLERELRQARRRSRLRV